MRAVLLMLALATALIVIGFTPNFQAEAAERSARLMNIAHRGASGYAPEHTMSAYELGLSLQGDFLEIDLQMTKDRQLIAMHDDTLDRTTNGSGFVKDFTLMQIKKLEAGSWFNEAYPEKAKPEFIGLQVPTLREVIEQFGTDTRYYIETKSPELYPGIELELMEILSEYQLIGENAQSGKVIIQSFSSDSLKRIHQMDENIPLIQLLSYYAPAVITDKELAKLKKYAVGISMHFTAISPGYVKKVRDAGLLINPYTVNESEDMKMLLDWGVSGMFTNYPDRLNDVIKEKN
jgi:glycerophosphoryl diester phosphodiesterase